jgi:hypothetical protein
MPVMLPLVSAVNFTPSSTELVSASDAVAGTVLLGHRLIVVTEELLVVNDQLSFAASAFSATSLTRGSVAPPRTVTV